MAKTILIVDDSADTSSLVEAILKEEGYKTMTASSGQEGLDLAREHRPDLIILDLMLPQINGYKVCRMLKFDQNYQDIPVIILTARSEETDEKLGYEVGADCFLNKPLDAHRLVSQVKTLLGRKKTARRRAGNVEEDAA